MKRIFLILGLVGAVSLFAGCASSGSGASADDEQTDQSATSAAAPHGNPLDTPDEATLSHVPGQ